MSVTARLPLDYSLAAESPAEHLKNALQVLRGYERSGYAMYLDDVNAVKRRIEAALALLERPR